MAPKQRLGDRDHRLLLAEARDTDRALAGGHDLARLDQRRGHDAAGVGDQRRIRERIFGQPNRALGAVEPGTGLVGSGAAGVQLGIRGPALGAQILGALLGGAGLRQDPGGSTEFGFGLLGLQFQIDFIERRQRLADIDGLSDFDQALCDLARDPKAHIGLDPGLYRADKTALGGFGLVMDGGDQHRTPRGNLLGRLIIAAG